MPLKAGSARKAITLVVLLALLGVLGVTVSNRWGSIGAPEATVAGRYSTEEQWIVAEIAQDIVEMASYPSDQRRKTGGFDFVIDGPQGEPPRAKVSFLVAGQRRLTHELVIRRHIWSPEDYESLGSAVLESLGLERSGVPPSTDETALAALTNLRARVIETQNQRVSARLRSSMLDSDAHEEAALLLGALTLREASDYFWDLRQTLCRMTAHLALARALRKGDKPGVSGRYAEAVLALGAGRAREALGRLGELGGDGGAPSAAEGAWREALRLRITGDWRATTDAPSRTLLEQLQYMRTLKRGLGAAAAFHFYERVQGEPVPDWGWIGFIRDFGTEVGAFAGEGVEPELAEARDVWQRQHARPLGASELAVALNTPAPRCITAGGPQVIAWGTWAAFLQRHACHRVLASDNYWRHTLGSKERAQEQATAFDRQLGGFVLYPFVQGLRWQHGDIELESIGKGLRAAVDTTAQRPDLVNADVWHGVRETTRHAVIRRRMPDLHPWFATPVPVGTAYDAQSRVDILGHVTRKDGSLDVLRERNPWGYGLVRRAILADPAAPKPMTVEWIRQAYGAMAEYSLPVLSWMGEVAAPRSPEREQILQDECRLLADECIDLASYLVALGRDDDAARAHRRAFDLAYDRVRVANGSGPLVRYYHERGRRADATRVAEAAAETGSAVGMETLAHLLEWQDRFPEAEELYVRSQRHYGHSTSVLAFYRRMVVDHGQASYESKLERLSRDTFPQGFERLDTATLPPVPRDGVQIQEDSRLWDLQKGDLVLGVDGWRIHDEEQYRVAKELDHRPEMRLHVWRGGRYFESAVRAMDRRLDTWVRTYP